MKPKRALSNADRDRLTEIIGHTFSDTARLERALTHSSVHRSGQGNYERLEFLGDRVLGLVIAELLFSLFPSAKEGDLSVRLNQLVSAETCAAVADELELYQFIRTGSDIKSLKGKRMQNVRADVMESLIAAIFLDAGLEAARAFILKNWERRARASEQARRDAKTELQEWAHSQTGEAPAYSIIERTGPDHDPLFKVRVDVEGEGSAVGSGRSRRNAEQHAATKLLEELGVWEPS
ncbi:ribonuclease III [Hoeflea prorocentri]|uniref:Ribonuclease 3 n=1 Tax=Hoeflea prorocentri TaxID=1922333 RepID=A0A9X3UIV8_9HYPH|nr:ribonuclease III [Hoeflea prorocentri]MCY6381457.1 ribonuclease III [Hoeflea prorocentri]MDA5399257.1 ribonuclease III [Hoeflea prorocentri]